MISVPAGTDDICLAYDILFGFLAAGELSKKDDIRLRRMKERIAYHIAAKKQYIIRRKPYIISRSDISLARIDLQRIIGFGVITISENKLVDLSFEFAKDIVNLVDSITMPKSSYMIDQLARAGTSVGANIFEAQYAHSRADFIAKLEIALKESNETSYWLKLLRDTGRISEEEHQKAEKLCGNIRRLLIASCSTAKAHKL